jgi:ATP-dependent protease ClpP protease subunit
MSIRRPNNLGQMRAAWRASLDVGEREAPCFRMVTNADGPPKLYVYDLIGGWDNDSGEFVRMVHGIDSDAIDLHINSPGGFVYDAVAMFEALAEHPADIAVKIDGLAASAASFLAQVGTTVDIAKAGRMMIHDAQVIAMGSPADIRAAADMADEISDDISRYYADRAGGKPADWRAAMTAETWYSASQAVDAKLADRVTGADKKTAGPDNRTRIIQARVRALTTLGG